MLFIFHPFRSEKLFLLHQKNSCNLGQTVPDADQPPPIPPYRSELFLVLVRGQSALVAGAAQVPSRYSRVKKKSSDRRIFN